MSIHRGRLEAPLCQYQSSCPSRLLAFDGSVYHILWCFSACHDGLAAHTAILYVSQSRPPSEEQQQLFFPFWSTHRQECQSCSPSGRHTACPEKLELGTLPSWLSLPLATVTDVLFNTRAGGGLGWSEYKLAHCLQEGECTANVAAKYLTHVQAHPFTVGFDGSSAPSLLFHMLFIS